MRKLAFSVLAFGFGLGSVQLSACSNSSDDCNATATCGATAGASQAGSAGKSGGGDDAGGGTAGTVNGGGSSNTSGTAGTMGVGGEGGNGSGACTGDVSDDAACWTSNELGVFVSSDSGDDAAGDGTKEAPFKTITKGIAAAAGKKVYVCVGETDYSEKISLSVANDGIQIYGGFECSTWTYATTRSAQVVSPSNIALRIDGLKKGVRIENVSFQAADATGDGADASSYGAFVTGSKGVALTRVELKAGKGAKGADGEAGGVADESPVADATQNGKSAVCTGDLADVLGGSWGAVACGSKGGSGGLASQANGGSGIDGIPSEHVSPIAGVQNGGPGATTAAKGSDGEDGMSGDAGDDAAASNAAGGFSLAGFVPADGKTGIVGFPGQGGGGGGASKGSASCRAASGGAGGMGGCGGKAGKGGAGGGASVGLLSWASGVALEGCSVTSRVGGAGGAGGKGGGGGAGANGGSGGQGDAGNGVARGGNGGTGGPGGNGGSGSGGTGGPSYALVFSKTKPTYTEIDTTLSAVAGGPAGVGGQVLTQKAPNGTEGAAAKEIEVE